MNTLWLLCNITESVKIVTVSIMNISMCMAYTINAQITDGILFWRSAISPGRLSRCICNYVECKGNSAHPQVLVRECMQTV